MVQDKKEIAKAQDSESPHFPVWRAVIAGWVLVTIPVLVIILSVFNDRTVISAEPLVDTHVHCSFSWMDVVGIHDSALEALGSQSGRKSG